MPLARGVIPLRATVLRVRVHSSFPQHTLFYVRFPLTGTYGARGIKKRTRDASKPGPRAPRKGTLSTMPTASRVFWGTFHMNDNNNNNIN